jgi:hypothetical protein
MEGKLMDAKVNDELLKVAEAAEPQQGIPVIVTVKPGTTLTVLEQKGLKIQHASAIVQPSPSVHFWG